MKRIARTNQGGSVTSFIVVGVVLVVILAVGVYWAYQRGAQVQSNTPIIGSTNQKATPQPQKSGDQTKSEPSFGTTGQTGQGQQSTSSDTGVAPGEIPQTGPSDTAYVLVVLAFLTFAATLYVRSRTSLRSL